MNQTNNFEEFCGGTFWNLSLTWDTPQPDFTPCFQVTILAWLPCVFLWVLLPFYAWYLANVPGISIPHNRLNISKSLLSCLLLILSLADLSKALYDQYSADRDQATVMFVTPSIVAASYLLTLTLTQVERHKGFITSGILFLFWTLVTIAGIVPFYSKILNKLNTGEIEDIYRFVTFYISYAVVIVQLVLSCITDTPKYTPVGKDGKEPCPQVQASFLSRMTFWWLNSLCLLGYRKSLEEKDLWGLNPRDLTRSSYPAFNQAWTRELKQTGWFENQKDGNVKPGLDRNEFFFDGAKESERTPFLKGQSRLKTHGAFDTPEPIVEVVDKIKKEPSLFKALFKVYGWTLMQSNICKLIGDLLMFTGPILQGYLIQFTEGDDYMWKGYLYAALFFITKAVNSILFHQMLHISLTLGMRIKAVVIAAVYRKALTMSNEARKTSTMGEIVNLMSVDAQRLQDVTGYMWIFLSSPLKIALAVYMLWGILGPSMLAGLAVMILIVPINAYLATKQRNLQIDFMAKKDARIKLMNEVLNGMKVLKLYAWEKSFEEKIAEIRNQELRTLRASTYIGAGSLFTWTSAPFMVMIASFGTYVLLGNQLDATTTFTSLSLFNIITFPINQMPTLMSYLVPSIVSIKRIGKFLQNTDLDDNNVHHELRSSDSVVIENGSFAWGRGKDDIPVLTNVNLRIPDGKLVAVVGQVGCGKSSLISACLGEMEKLQGRVSIKGSVGYVAQQAWIQNATLKDNILFSKDMDQNKYDKILDACALQPDLDILPGRDMTEIGEKGINLSGGQKQRVSLARAIYQDCDTYFLDDPLSAVDSHVGKHIFEQVIGRDGLLKDKTRILVTHGVHWLPKVDQILVLVNGEVSEVGTYEELLDHDGPFAQFLKTYLTQQDSEDEEEEDVEILKMKSAILEHISSVAPDDAAKSGSEISSESSRRKLRRRTTSEKSSNVSRHLSRMKSSTDERNQEIQIERAGEKLIQEEKLEKGNVQLAVFLSYCRSLGIGSTIGMFVLLVMYQASGVVSNIWLSVWTDDPTMNNISIANTSYYLGQRNMYLGVYGGLGVAQAVIVLAYALLFAFIVVIAAKVLHEGMLSNILRSPMSLFDTTPIGRILNRFSRDVETIDTTLPTVLLDFLHEFFNSLSIIIVISYSTPLFLSVVFPLGLMYFFIQRFYITTSRQLKRIESTTRSPVYGNFSETITGASTIRAFKSQDRFIQHSEDLVDHNLAFYFASIASNRWLGVRLELLGAFVVVAAALFAVLGRGHVGGGLVGLSLSYALQITDSLTWMVRMSSDLETNIVSVERVKEYTEMPTEALWDIQETKPSRDWPQEGRVEFNDYATRYRSELDLVLKGISLRVNGGEKVGIVGRTGAGKSSLTLALFRIIESARGSIVIDGEEISRIGLHQLRSKLTILPQDPVLFSGSLRMNLDPFDKYVDDQIWTALEHAHLKSFVSSLPAKLEYEVGEGGQSLSVGQRQLVCLARTLLRKTKILILDEATAAVDMETDELIQHTIRKEFAECTVLTIAHRLNTIMDSDKVLVLSDGLIQEFDSPQTLLDDKLSMFFSMAKDAGLVT